MGITKFLQKTKSLPVAYIEKLSNDTLQNYVQFAKNKLKLATPFKYLVGISSIKDYQIYMDRNNSLVGQHCIEEEIVKNGNIDSYDADISKVLVPFYEAIYESCDIRRTA